MILISLFCISTFFTDADGVKPVYQDKVTTVSVEGEIVQIFTKRTSDMWGNGIKKESTVIFRKSQIGVIMVHEEFIDLFIKDFFGSDGASMQFRIFAENPGSLSKAFTKLMTSNPETDAN